MSGTTDLPVSGQESAKRPYIKKKRFGNPNREDEAASFCHGTLFPLDWAVAGKHGLDCDKFADMMNDALVVVNSSYIEMLEKSSIPP
ncbi:hypothetical protein PUR_28980 [Paenibacillus sp. URB8-2]|nr:hypothetical protein PUR_28980 [Paenibacillus sp. URB8-2]